MSRLRDREHTMLVVVSLLWLGLLIGVSFLATPAKFLAPSLALPVALDVGRQTFAIFSKIELVLAVALLLYVFVTAAKLYSKILSVSLGALVAIQALWLLPALDARVEIILEGGVPPAAGLHELYIGIEVIKAVVLSLLAWHGVGAFRAGRAGATADGY